MIIESNQLLLRNFTSSDLNDVLEYINNSEVMKYINQVIEKDYFQKQLLDRTSSYAIVLKKTNKVIGEIRFIRIKKVLYEVRWIVNQDYWHQGYAYEISTELFDYAKKSMGIEKIICKIDLENKIAIDLAKKLDFSIDLLDEKKLVFCKYLKD